MAKNDFSVTGRRFALDKVGYASNASFVSVRRMME
jgi:hypothetical protein